MTDALIERWREMAREAGAWSSGDDPEPVLEALALSVALEVTGDLGLAPLEEREALRKLGQRALLQIGGGDPDEEELEELRLCAAIARDGLRALSGREPVGRDPTDRDRPGSEEPGGPDPRVLIPPSDLTRLLRGSLDGFAAGALAMKVRRSAAALEELRRLRHRRRGGEERSLALAAASAAPVLDPAAGRVIGALPDAGAEAVLFEGEGGVRRLAVYAEEPEAIRLLAPELTTEDVREGYWVGRIDEGAQRVDAVLEIGDRREPWGLSFEG